MGLHRTPLYERHTAAGARMVEFAGWHLPVQYRGILEEHRHTRSKASLFDTSHMGQLRLAGAGAFADLDRLFTGRLDDLAPGRGRYGFLLNPEGGIVDDIMVFRLAEDQFLLVVNAATTEKDRAWIARNLSAATRLRDESRETGMLALQGPLAAEVLEELAPGASRLRRFGLGHYTIAGVDALVSRTGYTGEDGFEIFLPWAETVQVWDRLLEHPEARPAGLGARDSLRLEKGYPLYGADIDEGRTPREAGLMRFVHWTKDFIGRTPMEARGEPREVLAGFVCEGRRIPRPHYAICADGERIGEVTSGGYSPMREQGIGLGYLRAEHAATGSRVTITDGRIEIQATIFPPPFV